jgi:hypothetical protein
MPFIIVQLYLLNIERADSIVISVSFPYAISRRTDWMSVDE